MAMSWMRIALRWRNEMDAFCVPFFFYYYYFLPFGFVSCFFSAGIPTGKKKKKKLSYLFRTRVDTNVYSTDLLFSCQKNLTPS